MIDTTYSGSVEPTVDISRNNPYPALRKIIKEEGLLDKAITYYIFKILSTLSLLAISITVLVLVDNFWFQLVNAAFLAFVFGQIGFLGHDAGHRNITGSLRGNEIVGLGASFLIGLSRTWWVTAHNQHHSTPNDLDQDPHVDIPVLAYTEEAALNKSRIMRFFIGYQAFYLMPLMTLEGLGLRMASFIFLWNQRRSKYFAIELPLLGLHILIYFSLLLYCLTPIQSLGFFLVHQLLFGLYYGTVFAPNHKGMLIIDEDNPLDFLRTQVLTTRNIKPGLIADFWYGGLNYQIEHHLFPLMPRKNFGKARNIIKTFCIKHDIAYYETSTYQSYKEILSYMHKIVGPVRAWPKFNSALNNGGPFSTT